MLVLIRNLFKKANSILAGLHKKETPREKGVLGVWDGSSFVFVKSSWYLVTLYRLLKKYGFDPLKNHFEIGSLLTDFKNIYDLLE